MQLNANIRMPQCHTSHYRFLLQYQLKGTLSCITQLTHLDATHTTQGNSRKYFCILECMYPRHPGLKYLHFWQHFDVSIA